MELKDEARAEVGARAGVVPKYRDACQSKVNIEVEAGFELRDNYPLEVKLRDEFRAEVGTKVGLGLNMGVLARVKLKLRVGLKWEMNLSL